MKNKPKKYRFYYLGSEPARPASISPRSQWLEPEEAAPGLERAVARLGDSGFRSDSLRHFDSFSSKPACSKPYVNLNIFRFSKFGVNRDLLENQVLFFCLNVKFFLQLQ